MIHGNPTEVSFVMPPNWLIIDETPDFFFGKFLISKDFILDLGNAIHNVTQYNLMD